MKIDTSNLVDRLIVAKPLLKGVLSGDVMHVTFSDYQSYLWDG